MMLWGLDKTLKFFNFRFNISFNVLNSSAFLVDFFNSKEVQQALSFLNMPDICSKVEFEKLNCTKINLNFLDDLEELGLVSKTGRIRMTFGDIIDSIDINSHIREAFLMEESEHYDKFSEEDKKELLIQLFKILIIGGSLNQYDETIEPYREELKKLYKEMVSIKKDPTTDHVYLDTFAFKISKIEVRKNNFFNFLGKRCF